MYETNSLRNTGKNALQGDPQYPAELLLQCFHSYYILTELSYGISPHTAVQFHKTQHQIHKPATLVSHLIETGPTVIARGLKDTNTETGRSQKIVSLGNQANKTFLARESGTKLSDLDYNQTDNVINGNTYRLQPSPRILTSLVWHVLLVQPCSATNFLTGTVTGILELETQPANQDKSVSR